MRAMHDQNGATIPSAGTAPPPSAGKRLLGFLACAAGVHHWSDWQVEDPDRPQDQVRTCTRCGLRRDNHTLPKIKNPWWNQPPWGSY